MHHFHIHYGWSVRYWHEDAGSSVVIYVVGEGEGPETLADCGCAVAILSA